MNNNTKNILKNAENLPEMELPKNLHNKIIGDIFFLKFKYAFLAAVAILPINLLFLGWRIWINAAESEIFTMISAMFNDFEISYDFIYQLTVTVTDAIPPALIIAFMLNLLLVVYIFISFQSTLKKLSFMRMRKI